MTHKAMNAYFSDYNKNDLIYLKSMEDPSKAYISKVELITSNPQNIHINGLKFEVQIHIKNSINLKNAGISFQVLNTNDIPVVHTWLFDSENPLFDYTTDELVLKCYIDTFRLYMGKYNCSIVLASYSGREIVEVIENICPFEIVMHEKKRDYEWQPNTCTYLEDFNWVRL
jgi:lipopolysaccharide transport system ATP-binding protein